MRKLALIFLTLISLSLYGTTYYVAPSTNTPAGSDSNAGTLASPWLTVSKAFTEGLLPGDTVFLRGGTYYYTAVHGNQIQDTNGTGSHPIVITNYPEEVVIWDYTNQTPDIYNYGFRIWNCDYIKVKGIEIKEIRQTDPNILITGVDVRNSNGVTIENVSVHDCDGIGFYAVDNDSLMYINCDSYNHIFGGEGDGWQISSYGSRSSTFFKGCRSWHNSDDAWDLAWNDGIVELDSCWAFSCGYDGGDGNGFKMGIGALPSIPIPAGDSISRVARNCIAAFNSYHGFTQNSADFKIHHYNCVAYKNGWDPGAGYGAGFGTFGNEIGYDYYRNCVAYDNYENEIWGDFTSADNQYNSWNTPPGISVSDDDFLEVDSATVYVILTGSRQSDGSLPNIDFLKLTPNSDLIDAGTDVGLDYYGDAPDLGWAEYSPGRQIIADHSIVDDYQYIPQYYIDSVKKMWVSYAGESHSQAIRSGLVLLENIDATYAVNVTEAGTPEAYTDAHLRASRGTWGDVSNSTGWIYGYGEEDWWTSATAIARTKAGITYANDNSLDIAAIGFGWCTDIIAWNEDATSRDPVYGCYWFGNSVGGPDGSRAWGLDADDYTLTANSVSMDTYLDATQQYVDYCATNGYDTKVFFTTGPIDVQSAYEPAYQAHVKHEYIRDYVAADTTRILFDYSDILAYDDGSETPQTATWTSYTYPVITDTNQGDETIGHIGSAGALRLGKAMWWMLARIAGWDGNVTVYSEGEEPQIDSTLTDILTFTLPTETGAATLNATNHTVAIEVSHLATITNLTPSISVSYGATISPASMASRDFTTPQTYTVTALDGTTTQEWVVTVTQAEEPEEPPASSSKIVKIGGYIIKL